MKKAALGIAITILIFFAYFVVKIVYFEKQKNINIQKTDIFQKLSQFSLLPNTPSVFIAFHPECEHCQYEAKSINEKQQVLNDINIVLFTTANDSTTHIFSKQYGLDSLKNVHIISDTTGEIRKLLDIQIMPTILIYNAQNQLIKRFNGETKIEAIIKYATPLSFEF